MENSPFAFLASLAGKPSGEAFAHSKSLLSRASGQETDHQDGEGFLSFLENVLTSRGAVQADAVQGQADAGFAAASAVVPAPVSAGMADVAFAPPTAPVENFTADAAPVEGLAAPLAGARTVQAAAPGAMAPAVTSAQSRTDAKPLPGAQQAAPAQAAGEPLQAVVDPFGRQDPSAAGRWAPADESLAPVPVEPGSEAATPRIGADEERILPRNPRVQSAPPGLSGNVAANASFALAENAAPDALAHAAAARGEDGVPRLETVSAGRLEILPANVMPVRDQIAAAVASRPGETRLEVRLDPPELGRVTITFDGDGADIVRAVVHADTPQTLDLMRRHADVFQRALEAQGFENLDLQFADRGPRENAGGEAQEASRAVVLAEEEAAVLAEVSAPPVAHGRLDRRM